MRPVKLAPSVLGLFLLILLVGASAAYAKPTFGTCVNVGAGKGTFTDAACQHPGTGSYEWKAFTVSVGYTGEGVLAYTDEKGGVFGEAVSIKCTVKEKGTVGPESADKTKEVVMSPCTTTEGTCSTSPEVKALKLEWTTELYEESGIRDSITAGSGSPGWSVKCALGVNDECSANTSVGVSNILENGELTGKGNFIYEEREKSTCQRGGANSGNVKGTMTVTLTEGGF